MAPAACRDQCLSNENRQYQTAQALIPSGPFSMAAKPALTSIQMSAISSETEPDSWFWSRLEFKGLKHHPVVIRRQPVADSFPDFGPGLMANPLR